MTSSETETETVARARTGDREAFDALVLAHRPAMERFCKRFLADASKAEDATQEVFLRAWEKLAGFRGECSFSTWLYRVARSVSLNIARKEKGIVLSLDDDINVVALRLQSGGPTVEDKITDGEAVRAVRSRLDARDDLIFVMKYQMDMNPEEISRALPKEVRLTPAGVSSRIARSIRQAIEAAKRDYDDF